MIVLFDVNEIRLMIRNLMSEMYNEGEICVYNRKEVNMIIERIVYKLDPNNMPDIEELKRMIEKGSSRKRKERKKNGPTRRGFFVCSNCGLVDEKILDLSCFIKN